MYSIFLHLHMYVLPKIYCISWLWFFGQHFSTSQTSVGICKLHFTNSWQYKKHDNCGAPIWASCQRPDPLMLVCLTTRQIFSPSTFEWLLNFDWDNPSQFQLAAVVRFSSDLLSANLQSDPGDDGSYETGSTSWSCVTLSAFDLAAPVQAHSSIYFLGRQ